MGEGLRENLDKSCLSSYGTGTVCVFCVFLLMYRIPTIMMVCSADRTNDNSYSFKMKIFECARLGSGTIIPNNVSVLKKWKESTSCAGTDYIGSPFLFQR